MCCHVATYTAPYSSHHYPPHRLPFTAALHPPPYGHLQPRPHLLARICKRAVICAMSYKNSKNGLKGCINDANCMRYLLVNRFHFPEFSILMLTEEADPNRDPSKQNMIKALYWLLQDCQPGDSLVFHYSGHGKRNKNYTGDEMDEFDDYLCPSDFKTQGLISDDEINAVIASPLPHGVKLHAFIDACHSGTALDLPFLCRMDRSGRYIYGRTIGLHPVFGKEQMVGRLFASVPVMITRPLLMFQY